MPFQKGNKFGGKKPGAGRKPKSREEELHSLLGDAWPLDRRRTVIDVLASRAQSGDVRAVSLILAYAYGTPPSGDEMRIQEAVDAEFDNLIKTLEKKLSPAAWKEVRAALRMD